MKKTNLIRRYGHSWVFLYWLIYLPWFGWLERHVTAGYYVIHTPLDRLIPFCEWFVVPYLLWFPFVAAVILWFFFRNKREFYQLTVYLYAGMTLFLVVSTVFPNGLALRPACIPRDNLLVELVREIWRVDTPTNVLPSLHVYNSVVCCAAVCRNRQLSAKRPVYVGTVALTAAIVLSTLFLKQHSVVDVSLGLLLAAVLYGPVYRTEPLPRRQLAQNHS